MKILVFVGFLNIISIVLCANNAEQNDIRKQIGRSASATSGSTSTSLNSLSSSRDNSGKSQVTIQSSTPHGFTRFASDFNSIPHSQNNIYPQTGSSGGTYYISVNPQNGQQASIGPAPTPVIMQYLPHNGQTGAVQYLQLIPTRPLLVPISPYISSAFNPFSQVSGSSASMTSASNNQAYNEQPQPYSSPSSHNYNNNFQPSISNPIGGFSNNYYSYFRPNNGMQIVSGPLDLSLNTNEYLPISSDSSYKMRRA